MTQTTGLNDTMTILPPNLTLFVSAASQQPLRMTATSSTGDVAVGTDVLISLH